LFLLLRNCRHSASLEWADQGGNVLVVLVARLGLGDADLAQLGRVHLDDGELGDVAVELVEALDRPGRHQAGEEALGDVELVFQEIAHAGGFEQAEGGFEDGADLVAGPQHVDRLDFHQLLQDFRDGGLAAAHGAEQVEDLLALLQTLGGVAEEADDPLDRLFHAVQLGESGVALDGAVEEDASETLILAGVHQFRFADGRNHPFSGCRPHHRIVATPQQIILK
jgi:hypothetical protein